MVNANRIAHEGQGKVPFVGVASAVALRLQRRNETNHPAMITRYWGRLQAVARAAPRHMDAMRRARHDECSSALCALPPEELRQRCQRQTRRRTVRGANHTMATAMRDSGGYAPKHEVKR